MLKIKPVLQNDLRDCGICSMEWIFNYYDGYIPLEKLREDTHTDKNGTNAYQIVNAFKKWNFDSYGIYVDDITCEKLKFPYIAHVKLRNGLEHFVVVKNIISDSIYLMDPAIGNKKMNLQKFNELFTGNVILAYPRDNIIKMNKGTTIYELFISIIKKEKSLIFKIVVTSLIFTIISIITSYYLKIGSGSINSTNMLKFIILIFGIFTILKVLFEYIRSLLVNELDTIIDSLLYPDFMRHLFNIPLKNIKSRSAGEINNRVEDLSNIKNLFSDIFISCFLDTFMFMASLIILLILNKKLFLVLIICLIIYIIVGIIFSKSMYKKILENIDYHTNYSSVLLENITMYDSIKHLNITKYILNKIEYVLSKYLLGNFKLNKFFNISMLFKNFILEICFFLINSMGFYEVLNNNLSIIDLFTFNILLSYCIDPIKNIINLLPKYNYIKASFSKITEFINIEEESIKETDLELKGNIEFNNVSYSYNNYDYLLNNVNFKISDGNHVLLNAPSGTGKSTICKLIYGEINGFKGEILIDNKNIKDISIFDLRNNILYVSQNEELFFGTIKENIIAYRDIDENYFLQICEICKVDDIVDKKEMRYESLIDISANNISGGEKQRIILARSLLKNANIIILDEALSEVDEDLEKEIIHNIRVFFKDKTLIYISHKSEFNDFDNILNVGELNGFI